MNKIKTIISICLFSILIISCTKTLNHKTKVKDIREKEIIVLRKTPSQKSIHAIAINISGTIKGKSEISLMLGNKKYLTNELTNNFSFKWNPEWYADTAKIIYNPINVQNGNVTIRYEFEDI